jgi:monoamine oxidase
MARTPLLRALETLARDHAAAEALGMTPEDVRRAREKAAAGGTTRREFLRTLGAGAAGALLAPTLLERVAQAATPPRIAIVGAGISGLSAALTLADGGLPSTVYESSGRVGGRMFSNSSSTGGGGYWDQEQVSEWCGELVDTGHKTIQALCRRFDLILDDLKTAQPAGATETYYFGGDYYPNDLADKDFQPVWKALKREVTDAGYPTLYYRSTPRGRELDLMSLFEWIERYVPGGHGSRMGQLLDVAYNIEYGAETVDQSSLNMIYLLGYNSSTGNFRIFGASDERYHIRGGNQRLPLEIARSLPSGTVQTGYRLRSIAQDPTAVTLVFDTALGSKTVTADYAILALPFAVLRNLDYAGAQLGSGAEHAPTYPDAGADPKTYAIKNLGRGNNGKLMVQFASRLWNQRGPWGVGNGSSYSDLGYQAAWEVSRAQALPSGMLVGYSGGDVTASYRQTSPYTTSKNGLTNGYAADLVSQLDVVYPGLGALWNGKANLSLPPRDPNFNCSYSYWKVGQYTAFSGVEKERRGRIHFAGEHCSQDFQGFMEGGASEGVRAGNEVAARVVGK